MFDGGSVGIGMFGTMCRSLSLGITRDGGRSLTSVITTAAHELGHQFGMQHDDGKHAKNLPVPRQKNTSKFEMCS